MKQPADKKRNRIGVIVFLSIYLSSHFAISRVSAKLVMRDWRIPNAFLYLPIAPDIVADNEMPLVFINAALVYFFYPAWKLDEKFLSGRTPMLSMPLRSLGEEANEKQ